MHWLEALALSGNVDCISELFWIERNKAPLPPISSAYKVATVRQKILCTYRVSLYTHTALLQGSINVHLT